jgi:hypothetical protein
MRTINDGLCSMSASFGPGFDCFDQGRSGRGAAAWTLHLVICSVQHACGTQAARRPAHWGSPDAVGGVRQEDAEQLPEAADQLHHALGLGAALGQRHGRVRPHLFELGHVLPAVRKPTKVSGHPVDRQNALWQRNLNMNAAKCRDDSQGQAAVRPEGARLRLAGEHRTCTA